MIIKRRLGKFFIVCTPWSDPSPFLPLRLPLVSHPLHHTTHVSTCVGKRIRASDTLCRTGRPFPLPASPFTVTPPPPSPTPPSESDEGESWPAASVSISLTQGGLRSTWKSAEILQLLDTSKRARLMKNGSTWGPTKRRLWAFNRQYPWFHFLHMTFSANFIPHLLSRCIHFFQFGGYNMHARSWNMWQKMYPNYH